MTLSEFKSWFEGFTEMMDGPPNAVQWERIQAKIGQIDDKPIKQVVYREYVERFRPYWPTGVYYGGTQPMLTAGALPRNGGMSDLGRAEYRSMVS